MPFHRIPGPDVEFALISFDDDGRERTNDPDGGVFSRTILDRVKQTRPSHVFLFSHGWKGDVPSAIYKYNRWNGTCGSWRGIARRWDRGSVRCS